MRPRVDFVRRRFSFSDVSNFFRRAACAAPGRLGNVVAGGVAFPRGSWGVLAVSLFLAWPSTGRAGTNTWTTIGPEGGPVVHVAVDPSNPSVALATAFYGAVLRTADGGTTWSPVASASQAGDVVFAPSNPAVAYAAAGSTFLRSSDGGVTWETVAMWTPCFALYDLAVDPTSPNTVYGTGGSGQACKTTDGGTTWTAAPVAGVPQDIVIDPFNSSIVYAGGSVGVAVSSDGGATWTPLSLSNYVKALAADPSTPGFLYAGTTVGLYQTTDGGATWSLAPGFLPHWGVSDIEISSADPLVRSVVFDTGMAYQSTDGGLTWQPLPTSGLWPVDLAFDPTTATTAYLALSSGGSLSKTVDGGATWFPIDTGVTALHLGPLAVSFAAPGLMFVADDTHIWKTSDGGATWGQVFQMPGVYVRALAADPIDPAVAYAAVNGRGIYKTTDGGTTWTNVWNTTESFSSLAIDPSNHNVILAGAHGSTVGIYKSIDGGLSWSPSNTGLPSPAGVQSVLFDPADPAKVYAGLYAQGTGVYESTDGGATWVQLAALNTLSLAIDDRAPRTIYAGTGTGVSWSADGGVTWNSSTGLPSGFVSSIAVDPVLDDVLYAAVGSYGVYRSEDGGATWQSFNTGMPGSVQIEELRVDPFQSRRFYAASQSVSALAIDVTCGNGVVDAGEQCDLGAANGAPGSCCTVACAFSPAGQVCRAAAGVCDAEETCTGASGLCPSDQKSTAVCRPAAGPCDAAEQCDGVGDNCPADQLVPAGTVCRPAAGACDAPEVCSGSNPSCPADQYLPSGVKCRAAAGVCDVPESCDGIGPQCPADQKSLALCRPAADVCDAAEYCDGIGNDCPADLVAPAGTLCRAASGECDVAEYCDGVASACPANQWAPAGTACGDPTASQCTNPDTCDGAGQCLANHAPDGSACEDGNQCTAGDTCQAGVCAGGTPVVCDDSSPCTVDTCDTATGCVFVAQPDPTCLQAGQAAFQVVDKGDPNKRKLAWKWKKGAATAIGDFGSPDAGTEYHLCIYDSSASAFSVAAEATIPAGAAAWRATRKGWLYKDKTAAVDGVKIVKLKAGDTGKAQVQLKASGAATNTPAPIAADSFFAQDPLVTVQMWNSSGICWGTEFDSALKNTGTIFKTKRKVIVP